jgi:hypothetical protein
MLTSGAGHIFDMIARMKANQTLRKGNRSFKTRQGSFHRRGGQSLTSRKATAEELVAIREKSKKYRQQDMRKTILTIILLIIFMTGLIWLLAL